MRCHPHHKRRRRYHGHHDHGHHEHHDPGPHDRGNDGPRYDHRGWSCGSGPVSRTFHKVMNTIADRFGLEKRWVVIGFIVGAFVHLPLAIVLFLVAWFWADHPAKVERWWYQLKEPFKAAPHPASGPTDGDATYADATYAEPDTEPESRPDTGEQKDPFFDDLRRKFKDLEERAARMEKEMTSDEFELRRQFRKMKEE